MDIGKLAYEAYCKATGGVSLISGATLPLWEALNPAIQDAWDAAATAVAQRPKGAGVQHNEETGLYHVILEIPDGGTWDVAGYCDEDEAWLHANGIKRWAQV